MNPPELATIPVQVHLKLCARDHKTVKLYLIDELKRLSAIQQCHSDQRASAAASFKIDACLDLWMALVGKLERESPASVSPANQVDTSKPA